MSNTYLHQTHMAMKNEWLQREYYSIDGIRCEYEKHSLSELHSWEKQTPSPKPEKFVKHDQMKARLAILFDHPKALAEVSRVLHFGAEKYSRKNWRNIPENERERYLDAPLRHIAAYCLGEKTDAGSKLHHLAHAICSLLFTLELELEKP